MLKVVSMQWIKLLCMALYAIINFRWSIIIIESHVILLPSGDISVCPGCELYFRCSTNLTYLEWNVTVFQLRTGTSESRRLLITSVLIDSSLTISGYPFSVTRDSPNNSYPLTSTLTVPPNVTIFACQWVVPRWTVRI